MITSEEDRELLADPHAVSPACCWGGGRPRRLPRGGGGAGRGGAGWPRRPRGARGGRGGGGGGGRAAGRGRGGAGGVGGGSLPPATAGQLLPARRVPAAVPGARASALG